MPQNETRRQDERSYLRELCDTQAQQLGMLLDVLAEFRRQAIRETDGYITISDDVVEALASAVDEVVVSRGGQAMADEWPTRFDM